MRYGKIKTRRLSADKWEVIEAYRFYHEFIGWVEIPVGFVTDYASVPFGVSLIIKKRGRHGTAAVIHDYLYFTQITTRYRADLIMLEIMQSHKVSKWKRESIYLGLHIGAGPAWEQHKKRIKRERKKQQQELIY